MYVTYNNLFKLLIDKGLNKTEFAREVGISSNTLAKLSKNELVSLEVLVRICRHLLFCVPVCAWYALAQSPLFVANVLVQFLKRFNGRIALFVDIDNTKRRSTSSSHGSEVWNVHLDGILTNERTVVV